MDRTITGHWALKYQFATNYTFHLPLRQENGDDPEELGCKVKHGSLEGNDREFLVLWSCSIGQ